MKSFAKSDPASASHSLIFTLLVGDWAARTFGAPKVGRHSVQEPSTPRPMERSASCCPHTTLSAIPPPAAGLRVRVRSSPLAPSANPVFGDGTTALLLA